MAKSDKKKQEALQLYMSRNFSNRKIAERVGISEATLYNWKKAGELTNGTDWEDYREEVEREQVALVKQREARELANEQRSFLQTVQHDIADLYEMVHAQIASGNVEVRVKDVSELVRLHAMLDSQAADKVAWMERFAMDMFEIALEIMDDRQFALFKTRAMQLQDKKINEMGAVAKATIVD